MNRLQLLLKVIFPICLLATAYWWISSNSSQPINKTPDSMAHYEAKHAPSDYMYVRHSWPDNKPNIKAFKKAMKKAKSQTQVFSPEGFAVEWTTQGPGNTGARVNSIAVDPTDEDIIYAGFSTGGIFKTTDGGTNWFPIFDDQPYLAIADIVLDPTNSDIIYVATGDVAITGYPAIGDGIYKSTDGGMTWTNKGLNEHGVISRIQINPDFPNVLYAASMGTPFERSTIRGVYKSVNGGDEWFQMMYVSDSTGIIDIVLDPVDPEVIYAAGWDRIRNNSESVAYGYGARVFRSEDGGFNWDVLSGGMHTGINCRVGLAVSGTSADVIYSMIVGPDFQIRGVYKSTDRGDNWTEIANNSSNGLTNSMGGMGWYFGRIKVDPNDDGDLYIPGLRLMRSQDGGTNWSIATPTGSGSPHVDNHEVVFTPSGDIIIGTDGGMYRKASGSSTWEDIENIPATQVYRTAWDPHNPGTYYAGAQDNGTHYGDSSNINNWTRLAGADGFQMAFHPDNPLIRYIETQNGSIFASTDGSAYFFATSGINASDRRNWDMQYILSPSHPSSLYTGTYRVYKNTNSGQVPWSSISPDLTDGNIFGSSFHNITTLSESPLDSNTIYVGTTDGNVWRTTDDGGNWTSLHANLPDRYVTSVIASPDEADHVFVGISGYRDNNHTPHIFKSTDQGDNWIAIDGNLPDLGINNIFVMPNNNGIVIFVATDGGVYATLNGGTSWDRLGENFPFVITYDLDLNETENLLIAATFGRSVLTFPLDSIGVSLSPPAVVSVGGNLEMENGAEINNVKVFVSGGVTDSLHTGESGNYVFPAIPSGSTCTITPFKDTLPVNGVNILDVFFIQTHILASDTLDTPYKILAADVNRSGSVNILDVFYLHELILVISDDFEFADSWRFIRSDHVFTDPLNPWNNPIPESYECNGISGSLLNVDFVGIKTGDVNNSANPQQVQGEGDTRNELAFALDNISLKAGEEYTIDFKAKDFNQMIGYQFTLDFEESALEMHSITKGLENTGIQQFNENKTSEGFLSGVWSDPVPLTLADEEVLFSITIKAKTNGYLADLMELTTAYAGKLAFDINGNAYDISLDFDEVTSHQFSGNISLKVGDFYPNPFSQKTAVDFNLPGAAKVEFSLFDVSGKLIWENQKHYESGTHRFELSAEKLRNSGIYILKIKTENQIISRKVLYQ